jgi:signal transduction histidine kinase/CheY-like chemotaxis protein
MLRVYPAKKKQVRYCFNIADVYLRQQKQKEAKVFLDKITNKLATLEDDELFTFYYSFLGTYYQNEKDITYANVVYRKLENLLSKKNINLNLSNQSAAYYDLYDFFKKTNNTPKALFYLEKHDNLLQKISKKEKDQKIKFNDVSVEMLELNSKIDKIEAEKKVQEKIAKQAIKTERITLFFVGLLFILLMFLAKNFLDYKKLNKKLNTTNLQLIAANKKSEEASILKSQFMSNVSHELRTPLYGVIGMADIIENEHQELKKSKYFNALKFSSNYLLSLINDVLNVYKIEDNKFEFIYGNFDIRKETNTIKESLMVISNSNNNKLELVIDPDVPKYIKTDITRFSQILINLVSNGLKFTKNGKVSIYISFQNINHKEVVQLKISDTGIGIPENYLHKIFEKFVQVDVNLQEQYKGTGLGLSIVKKLVELFNGQISVESKINEGSVFTVDLPYIKADDIVEAISDNAIKSTTPQNLNILVVEDNKINQMVTKKFIEKTGNICTIVENGFLATEMVENASFDLILMDINMPIMNGFEATKIIREKGINCPIIALTASDKHDILNEVKASGINDILVKPYEQEALIQIIRQNIS